MVGFGCGGIWVLLWWVGPCSVNPQSNFLLLCGAVFPPCSLACDQTMIGIMELMETFLPKDLCQDCCIQCSWPHNCWPTPLQETPRHSQASLVHSLVGSHRSFLLGPGAHKVLFVPSQKLFPQSCGRCVIKCHWPLKSNFLGILCPSAGSPGWEICCEP